MAKLPADILAGILKPDDGDLPADLARIMLSLEFTEADHERVELLGRKCNRGTLSSEELSEYQWYVVVGDFLTIMRLKALQSLRGQPSAA